MNNEEFKNEFVEALKENLSERGILPFIPCINMWMCIWSDTLVYSLKPSGSQKISKTVVAFSICREALEWAQEKTINAAFLDISMRGMGGMTLAEKLLELKPE